MGNSNSDESRLRGKDLGGAETKTSVEHTDYEKRRNPDTTLRTDGEEDTLYDDGLEIEDDSRPLTGVDGKDDSISNKDKDRQ
jgi:hypothetical protein